MSKNIVVISASPRRGGNSDYLCDQFVKGAQESGHNVEKIFFHDKKINYCLGCGACYKTHKCVIKDDMDDILNKMVNADVLVFATPVYFYTMDAQLKTLIDRTVPRYTELKGDTYLLATLADRGEQSMTGTLAAFQGFVDCLSNVNWVKTIVGYGAWNKGEIIGNPAVEESYNAGLNIK